MVTETPTRIQRPLPVQNGQVVDLTPIPQNLETDRQWPVQRPQVDGKFLRVDGARYWIKGVTYGTFRPNSQGEPYPEFDQLRRDFAAMRAQQINTVRLYTPPSDRIADAAAEAGLRCVVDVCWGMRRTELDDPERVRYILDWTRSHVRRLAAHPALLLYSIGNEITPLVVRWHGRQRVQTFLHQLYEIVKEEDPEGLVTYVNHPPTEYLSLPFLDLVSYNVYLEQKQPFRAYLDHLQNLAGSKPLFLAELGFDSHKHGLEAQAELLRQQLEAVFQQGLCGAAIYSWSDEWAIFEEAIDGWAFGLNDDRRAAKPALHTVAALYSRSHYTMGDRDWPLVSVVVATHNGSCTIQRCLDALLCLNYPHYEVIVVDDGSTDATPQLVQTYPVRLLRTAENGGLSRARNLGIAHAQGEIVAFTDDDTRADPDWLYFMVEALQRHGAAAVGGPNLGLPNDPFIAQCVNYAPGNPTHVLLDEQNAEHIPGCNMAFRKEILEALGGFDVTHRAAGDDVDLCWRLLVRDRRIVYSPAAQVWHHRRSTIRGYLRQQRGYGHAEAHLQHRYAGRFNVFGHSVWRGRIYGGASLAWPFTALPALFRPQIYQGRFGSALFASIYQPATGYWLQTFMTVEWLLLALLVLASAGLSALWGAPLTSGLLLCAGLALLLLPLSAAAVPAVQAVRDRTWTFGRPLQGTLIITALHLLQPVARAVGRLQGWWQLRRSPSPYGADMRVWGNLAQRERWLNRLHEHLVACGWLAEPSSDWGAADLDVLGPGPYRLQLSSVYEEYQETGYHFVRFRITARTKPWAYAAAALIVAALAACVWLPSLLPLALPAVLLLGWLLRSRRSMVCAVAQLALECAEAQQMPRADHL